MVSFRTSLIALAAAFLVVAAPASAGNGRFTAGQKLGVSFPQSIAVADFNGDGRADVASPSANENLVYLYLGKVGGGFDRAPDVTTGLGPRSIVAADFNRDGREDLAVSNADGKKVTVRLGKDGGGFTDAPDITFTQATYALAVGDFNNDGKDDLAVGDFAPTGSSVHIELGTGTGTFAEAPTTIPVRAAALAVGDLNSDGVEDIAFTRFENEAAGRATGVGDGQFQLPENYTLPGAARGVAVGDFNADRREDVVFAIRDKGIVSIVDHSSTSQEPHNVPVGKEPYAVAVGDFNLDGYEDIAATNLTDKTVSVLVNRHDDEGTFARQSLPTGPNPVDVAVGNLAGDANDDLAIASADGAGGIEIKRGLGTPPLAGNLLKNGGFEGPNPSLIADDLKPIPGWQSTGMTFVRYGRASHSYFRSWIAAPRHGAAGGGLLWGGYSGATNGINTVTQTVDVSKRAKQIDAGHGRTHFSAYLGGALGFDDAMSARAEFVGKGGATLRALKLGPVTDADRKGLTTLLRRAGATQLPRGTRRIRVRLTSVDADKSYSSAVADNVKLTLDARADFRGSPRLSFSGVSSPRASDPAQVRVASDEPFRVSGEVRARTVKRLGPGNKQVALGSTKLGIPAGGSRVAKFPLPPAARAEMAKEHLLDLVVTAIVRDAAGHTRTLVRTVRLQQAA